MVDPKNADNVESSFFADEADKNTSQMANADLPLVERPPLSASGAIISELQSGPNPVAPAMQPTISVDLNLDEPDDKPTLENSGASTATIASESSRPNDDIPESIELSMTLSSEDLAQKRTSTVENTALASTESAKALKMPAHPRTQLLPVVLAADAQHAPPSPEEITKAQARIDAVLREARAQGTSSSAAPLWFEAGWIFENELGKLREAAAHYEQAHNVDPTFLPVIHATRRLFAQLGKWSMVNILLDKELEIEGAPKASLYFEKARILETKLGKVTEAIALYQKSLDISPAFAPAVDALFRHQKDSDNLDDVVSMLEKAVAASEQKSQKQVWLIELGRISESQLSDDGKAIDYYSQVRALEPAHKTALLALRRLFRRADDDNSSVEILEILANSAQAPSEKAAYYCERSQKLTHLGEMEQAAADLQKAQDLSPKDTRVLTELTRLYRTLQLDDSLEKTLIAQAQASRDTSEKVALFVEAAELAEEKLNAPQRAITYYGSALELQPTYQPALAAAGRLFARSHRWADIARLYEVQLQVAQEDSERIPLLFKFAELLGERLGDEERAITELRAVLNLSPGYVPALKMISGLFARQARWQDLIDMYESELAQQKDHDQAIYLLDKIGVLYEKEVGDSEKAIHAYRRMLEYVSGYLPALRSLGRLYAKTEQWDLLIAVNDEEAELVGDQNQIVALFHRNGEIYERQGRNDDAVEAYQRALTLMPNYLPSLKALGSLYAKSQRFDDLISMHRQEAEVARRAEQRAQLLYVVACIYEDKLEDQAKAADAYREVLQEVSSFAPAIRALARIAEATGDWNALVNVLKRQLEGIDDTQDKALVHIRIARILEVHNKDQDAAITQLDAAIAICPTLQSAHEQKIRLFEVTQSAREEVKAREALDALLEDEERKISNQHAIAELYLHHLKEPQKCIETLERILALSPDDVSARREALKVSLNSRDYAAAIRHATTLAQLESEAAEVANLYLQIAAWQEAHLDPAADSLESYVRVLQYEPLNPIALRAVERAYVERQCWNGLYQLYEQEYVGVDEKNRRADLCMKMGELAERRLGSNENAILSYERALDAVPDLLPALDRLKELYGRLGRDKDQLKMLALEANASKDPVKAIETLLDVGALQRDKFQDLNAAVESFQKVLTRDPGHERAFSAIEDIYQQQNEPRALAQLYAARANALSDPELKAGLLTRVARIHLDVIDDVDAALAAFHQILLVSPQNVGTLRTAADLHYDREEYEQASALYAQLLPLVKEPTALAKLHYRLGIIYSAHLPDAQKTIHALSIACRSLSPQTEEYTDSGRKLAAAYRATEQYDDARLVLSQLAQSASLKEHQLEFRLALAELIEEKFDDVAGAAVEIKKALHIASNEQKVGLLNKVTDLYERAQDLEGYLSVATEQAKNMMREDKVRAAQLYQRCAELAYTQLKDLDRAISFARLGLDIDENHVKLRGFLADRLSEVPSRFGLAIEEHRRVLRAGHLRAASITHLFSGWNQQRAYDRAFVAAEALDLLGLTNDESSSFYSDNLSRVPLTSEEVLDESGFNTWLVHPQNRNVIHDILCLLASEIGKVNPDDEREFQIERKDILKHRSDDSLRKNADAIVKIFGGGLTYEVHRSRAVHGRVEAIHRHPPVLLVSANICNIHDDREQKFLFARKLMALMCGHQLVQHLDESSFADFLSAVGKAVDKTFEPLRPNAEIDALAKRIGSALSRGAKKQLQDPIQTLDAQRTHLNLGAFLAALPFTQNRAGLVAGNSLRAAVHILQAQTELSLPDATETRIAAFEAHPQLNDLLCYALSDDYFAARQTLRFAIDA